MAPNRPYVHASPGKQIPSGKGWLCPACGAGVAPHVERCPCVSEDTISVKAFGVIHEIPLDSSVPFKTAPTGERPPSYTGSMKP